MYDTFSGSCNFKGWGLDGRTAMVTQDLSVIVVVRIVTITEKSTSKKTPL